MSKNSDEKKRQEKKRIIKIHKKTAEKRKNAEKKKEKEIQKKIKCVRIL